MSRDSQGVFPRLAIVGSRKKNAQKTAMLSPGCEAQMFADGSSTELRTATANGLTVMPKRSFRGPLSTLGALWSVVRNRLVTERAQRRRAAVLAFRGHALLAPLRGAAPIAGEDGVDKKASESVRWENDRPTVSQEEGRG